jgi:RHS repeat-associated protein
VLKARLEVVQSGRVRAGLFDREIANRLTNANGQAYTWIAAGNLLNTGVSTNTFNAANRLTSATRLTNTLAITYDGLNNRVRQTSGISTTNYTLDTASALPEVISTTNGTAYLHLPGLIMAQNAQGQRAYLLPDGLGSVRQVVSGTSVIAWRDYDPYGQVRLAEAFTNTFDTSLEGWAFDSAWDIPAVLSNPPGVMRLASTQTPPYPHYATLTVKKPLSGAPGALTISTFFTVTSWATIQFWVAYTDGSTDYIFLNGTTPAGTYSASYTTPANKTAVALYLYTAASYAFPPYQVDVDWVSVIPATPSSFSPPPYAFTGEWWEQDVRLLHLRARWYDGSSGIFLSKDPWPGDAQRPQSLNGWSYVEGNPVNRVDPSGRYGCLLYESRNYEMPLADSCDQGTGGGAIIVIGLYGITVLFGDAIREAVEAVGEGVAMSAEELRELYNRPSAPEPDSGPKPLPIPYNPQLPTPTCPPDDNEGDYIWRGTGNLNPATGDFHPRPPKYNPDGSVIKGQEGDIGGLSFFEGRFNMWRETAAYKAFRAGFTEEELISAGFSIKRDGGMLDPLTGKVNPLGHVSVKRGIDQEWSDWLHRIPGQPYSERLRDLARQMGRSEPNIQP